MRCLGIDPGLATVGVGLVEAENRYAMKAIDWMTINTQAGLELAARLAEIETDLTGLVRDMKPDKAAVERLFFAVNEQSALEVAQARGVILSVLHREGIPIIEPTPLQVKLAITGDGQADKRQMQEMVQRLLELPSPPSPADAADALALGIYAMLQA